MKFTPYSFSKLNTFEQCPMKFKFKYIDKISTPFKMNATLEKGSYIHLLLEELAKNDMVLPKVSYDFKYSSRQDIVSYKKTFRDFVFSDFGEKYLSNDDYTFFGAEVEFGVKLEDGVLSETSYWNKKALFRGKIDHVNIHDDTMYLLDWKSGRVNQYPAILQLVMYAVWCFLKYENINIVKTAFVYIEHGVEKTYTFKRKHLDDLIAKVMEKINNVELETKFNKKESKLCEYCEFRLQGLCKETSNIDINNEMLRFIPKRKIKNKEEKC